MNLTQETFDQLNLLLKFPTESMMQGLKIHHDADPSMVAAAQALFDKGITTQPDGGYLTDLGLDLIEHANVLAQALSGTSAN